MNVNRTITKLIDWALIIMIIFILVERIFFPFTPIWLDVSFVVLIAAYVLFTVYSKATRNKSND